MAAITATAASILWASGPREPGTALEAFAAGAILYRADNGQWGKAQNDGTAVQAGERDIGVALSTADVASANVQVATRGAIITWSAHLIAAGLYFLHSTAGSMTLTLADVGSTNYMTVVGIGRSTTSLYLYPVYAGAVLA